MGGPYHHPGRVGLLAVAAVARNERLVRLARPEYVKQRFGGAGPVGYADLVHQRLRCRHGWGSGVGRQPRRRGREDMHGRIMHGGLTQYAAACAAACLATQRTNPRLKRNTPRLREGRALPASVAWCAAPLPCRMHGVNACRRTRPLGGCASYRDQGGTGRAGEAAAARVWTRIGSCRVHRVRGRRAGCARCSGCHTGSPSRSCNRTVSVRNSFGSGIARRSRWPLRFACQRWHRRWMSARCAACAQAARRQRPARIHNPTPHAATAAAVEAASGGANHTHGGARIHAAGRNNRRGHACVLRGVDCRDAMRTVTVPQRCGDFWRAGLEGHGQDGHNCVLCCAVLW